MSGGALDGVRALAAAASFPREGELRLPGPGGRVEVRRDLWGATSLRAGSLEDLWFAQGVVTAGERLFQLDLALRQATGRLSEVFADRTLADDRFVRTIGLHRAGAAIASAWNGRSVGMMEAFVAGARAWVDAMPAAPVEYALLDLEPQLPTDLAAWAACWSSFAWSLSGNWDRELLRAALVDTMGPDAAARLVPSGSAADPGPVAPGVASSLLGTLPSRPTGLGSNAWAIAGGRTATGLPILANDPHLTVQQPCPWLEMHLSAPGYRARGVAAPFVPGIVLGTTAHHAWGVTNVGGDVADLYEERLSEDGGSALHGDAWEPLDVRIEEIRVRGAAEPHALEVRSSRHGPLLEVHPIGRLEPEYRPAGRAYALRWAGADRGVQPDLVLAIAQAEDFESFRRAMWGLECPGQNVVYADVDGTVGYQCTGSYPVRAAGNGTWPVPGWTDEHEWTGWVPFEELPWSATPVEGVIVSANDRMHDDAYPHLIGHDLHAPHRAMRIVERIAEIERHTVETVRSIQLDTVSLAARRLLAIVPDPIRERFGGWDGDMRADSPEAARFAAWTIALARRVVPDDELRAAYLDAWEPFVCEVLPTLVVDGTLDEADLGAAMPDAPTAWGELHRATFRHPLGQLPGLEDLFVAAEVALGGDEQTVAQAASDHRHGFAVSVAASCRAVYDLADLDRSVGVLTTGNSGNPASANWNDQAPLWAAGEHHRLPFTDAAVEAEAVSTLVIDREARATL